MVAGFAAALVSAGALFQTAWVRRAEHRERLTAVAAWAEPTVEGRPIDSIGATVWVRNYTQSALQESQVLVRLRDPDLTPRPDGVLVALTTHRVPPVPPGKTVAFSVRGSAFRAYEGQIGSLVVDVLFQDASGVWWWKQANGRLWRNQVPTESAQLMPLEEAFEPRRSAWKDGADRVLRRARRGRPRR